jgi:hypothetical protein
MPVYFFNLKTTDAEIRDPDGTEFDDEPTAWEHARQVARELMKHREPQSRSWRIDVRDGEGRHCFELLFASVDDSIAPLDPELRTLIENLHRKQASLVDAIAAVRLALRHIQATTARSKGKPFLASLDGMTIAVAEPAAQCNCGDAFMAAPRDRLEIANNLRPPGSYRPRPQSR